MYLPYCLEIIPTIVDFLNPIELLRLCFCSHNLNQIIRQNPKILCTILTQYVSFPIRTITYDQFCNLIIQAKYASSLIGKIYFKEKLIIIPSQLSEYLELSYPYPITKKYKLNSPHRIPSIIKFINESELFRIIRNDTEFHFCFTKSGIDFFLITRKLV